MKNYEILSDNCKIMWHENFEIGHQEYTQVSGYIFNDKNQLLIVRNGTVWTIPGGHPEPNETPINTLDREVMEESCVTLRDTQYLGAVEVVENSKTYYQLRYTARVKDVLPFKQEWEILERKFVDIQELHKYITWSNGITFQQQINSSKKYWDL